MKSHENNPNRVNKVHEISFWHTFKRDFLERARFPREELGEKCEKHIFFLQEKAEGELGHDFQTGLGVILSWHKYQGATITATQKLR